ncbi:uncharacterized protein TOT_030000166 [Theileria orientalis strain Shintoku]|uniref:SET domain-containing protein n=1 Tax=Theileria orientalis strain Shintoku TaxID=869250 RepID=J4D8P4_THEOR|nr:uncharacterized protein TOT_030000166 [Theileria orientalis strain Shintoku]BAM40905.1 uncharacterized protein TOT_030000166 [Theileria orientalis strain Shintoku]|eukprot:XP_009691206.1 uncharacterized protein TOT_030000166 [Theileria orientalis strain Shintoku]
MTEDEKECWKAFKRHALKTHENFIFAVEIRVQELSMIYQIINANNNQLGLDDINETIQKKELYPETMGLGLFNYLSKMNHSCEPNLQIEYTKNNIAHIAPLVDVPRGEEATISYIDEKDSVENRQEKLYKNYGFKCDCNKCILEGSNYKL